MTWVLLHELPPRQDGQLSQTPITNRFLDILMAGKPRLRVYFGTEDERMVEPLQADRPDPGVQIPLEMLTEALVDAEKNERFWVKDWADETVTVSRDLSEIIHAYLRLKRRAA